MMMNKKGWWTKKNKNDDGFRVLVIFFTILLTFNQINQSQRFTMQWFWEEGLQFYSYSNY